MPNRSRSRPQPDGPQPMDRERTTEHDRYFGYQEQLEQICRLTAQRRLVTVVGPGGAGKSRAARRAAAALVAARRFAAAGRVAPGRRTGAHDLESAARGLARGGAPVLLVVDDCENALPDCAPAFTRLAAAEPGLHLLVTSREPLRVVGESVFLLKGLPCPPAPHNLPDVAVVSASPAVRLFLDRAASAGWPVALTAQDAAAIARICRALEGNPLALEMASALTAVLAPREIAARLEQSVDLLTRGYRTARLRHHSLRASLVHSVSALSAPARALLRRLGVFPGEFTLAAVEAVCAPPRSETGGRPLIDVLAELVDKHLVLRAHDWFRLTAPARLDARARLCHDGGWPEAVAAHAAWCARLADQIGASLGSGAAAAALPLLDRNSANLLAALRAADETADPAGPAAIAAALVRYWLRHDCAHRFRGGRGPAPPTPSNEPAADFTLARRWIERAADRGLLSDDSRTPEHLGVLSALEGDFPRARWLLNIAVERAGASRRGREAASARCSLAVAVLLDPIPAGPPVDPEAELEAARTQYRTRADAAGEAFAAVWLALAAARADPAGRAPTAIDAACGPVADSGDEALTGARATVALARGEPARALELAGAEAAAWERIGAGAVRSGPVLDPALAEAWQALGAVAAARHWARGMSGSEQEAGPSDHEAPDTGAGVRPRSEREALALLSPRELEVVRRVARGQTSARIAKEFVISPRTVDTHVDHVRTKLGLHSRAEVAAWAASLGIA